jgi:hypothetical protein
VDDKLPKMASSTSGSTHVALGMSPRFECPAKVEVSAARVGGH